MLPARRSLQTMSSLAILGAGMQGVAAAYDCALYGDFDRIVLADFAPAKAEVGAERINRLLGREVCGWAAFDATDRQALRLFLADHSLAIGALPYKLHFPAEEVGVEVGCGVVDMGQDTEPALAIHARDAQAKAKGVAVVTDCGLAPGLVNVFAADLIARCEGATHAVAYCGGLPCEPIPPLGYALRFSMESVIGEYSDEVLALRDGEIVTIGPMGDLESIEFDGVGPLEAFSTSGGSGTAPYSFRGRIANYEYKTMRYPGHAAAMKLFRDCGFWSEEPHGRLGTSPRAAFSAVLEERLAFPDVADMILVRVEVRSPVETLRIELVERDDPATGFTAMERLTGFSTAIVALAIRSGHIAPGCHGCEAAIDPAHFEAELRRRGIGIRRSGLRLG
ncbi:MAG TPA: saccharopine dehydrogenase C-terminal domain-containing protein [Fimbriimonadaceae bacterium]|nr:saccharopine dehydrogenase C-terminal domain-containing protein [Fimbriimonadaceae bacterium]